MEGYSTHRTVKGGFGAQVAEQVDQELQPPVPPPNETAPPAADQAPNTDQAATDVAPPEAAPPKSEPGGPVPSTVVDPQSKHEAPVPPPPASAPVVSRPVTPAAPAAAETTSPPRPLGSYVRTREGAILIGQSVVDAQFTGRALAPSTPVPSEAPAPAASRIQVVAAPRRPASQEAAATPEVRREAPPKYPLSAEDRLYLRPEEVVFIERTAQGNVVNQNLWDKIATRKEDGQIDVANKQAERDNAQAEIRASKPEFVTTTADKYFMNPRERVLLTDDEGVFHEVAEFLDDYYMNILVQRMERDIFLTEEHFNTHVADALREQKTAIEAELRAEADRVSNREVRESFSDFEARLRYPKIMREYARNYLLPMYLEAMIERSKGALEAQKTDARAPRRPILSRAKKTAPALPHKVEIAQIEEAMAEDQAIFVDAKRRTVNFLDTTAQELVGPAIAVDAKGQKLHPDSPYTTANEELDFTDMMEYLGIPKDKWSVARDGDGTLKTTVQGFADEDKSDHVDKIITTFGETNQEYVDQYVVNTGLITEASLNVPLKRGAAYYVEVWQSSVQTKTRDSDEFPTKKTVEVIVRTIEPRAADRVKDKKVNLYARRGAMPTHNAYRTLPSLMSDMNKGPVREALDAYTESNSKELTDKRLNYRSLKEVAQELQEQRRNGAAVVAAAEVTSGVAGELGTGESDESDDADPNKPIRGVVVVKPTDKP